LLWGFAIEPYMKNPYLPFHGVKKNQVETGGPDAPDLELASERAG